MGVAILFALVVLQLSRSLVLGRTLNIIDFGAIPGDTLANLTNRAALTMAFSKAVPGDTGGERARFRTEIIFESCV